MDPFIYITVVTLIAGVGGTGIGGIIGALFKSDSNRTISLLLAFAGGVMTAMVCFDLLAESVEAANEILESGVFMVVVSVIAGVAVVYGLNEYIDKRTSKNVPHTASDEHPDAHDDIDELIHADNLAVERKKNESKAALMVAGIVMAAAIALHNIPEGMTIGASFAVDETNLYLGQGLVMAVLIGLHNVPEGMAVSVPLISGGMRRLKAIGATAACGIPTLIGAWLGYWVGDIGPLGLTLSLGFASGAMLYMVFGEIVPQSVLMYRSRIPSFAFIAGILLGLMIIFL